MSTIIVTGAGGGVGLSLAAQLLKTNPNAHHYVFQYRKTGADELLALLGEAQTKGAIFQGDLVATGDAAEMVRFASDTFGEDLGGLVNLAGGNRNAKIEDVEAQDFRDLFDQNVMTVHNTTRAFVAAIREKARALAITHASIVNVSSCVAKRGAVGATPYAACKAAIEGYTRSIAQEVARDKISVNCIQLGYMDAGLIRDVPEAARDAITKRISMRRFGESGRELANVVRFLLDGNNYITGQILPADGGLF